MQNADAIGAEPSAELAEQGGQLVGIGDAVAGEVQLGAAGGGELRQLEACGHDGRV